MTTLHLMVGLPCSGKSTWARALEERTGALRLTPDEWHLRLFGQDADDPEHDRRHQAVEDLMWEVAEDVPGIIGTLGKTMGENGVNIANFTLGRSHRGGEAIAILYVDDPVPEVILDQLRGTGMFSQVKALQFDMA